MVQLEMRKSGGALRDELNLARDAYRERKTFENGVKYARTIVSLLIGCRPATFLHHTCFLYFYSLYRYCLTHSEMDLLIKRICRTRFFRGNKKCFKIYPFPAIFQYTHCEKSVLYHMTPSKNRDSIITNGLKPGTRLFVYMTDSLDYYMGERVSWFGGEAPMLFKIDAKRLQELGHTIYRNAGGEYVTDCVESECLEIYDE